jgi:hypothetical protein
MAISDSENWCLVRDPLYALPVSPLHWKALLLIKFLHFFSQAMLATQINTLVSTNQVSMKAACSSCVNAC